MRKNVADYVSSIFYRIKMNNERLYFWAPTNPTEFVCDTDKWDSKESFRKSEIWNDNVIICVAYYKNWIVCSKSEKSVGSIIISLKKKINK